MINEYLIFIVGTILYIGVLNKFIFSDSLFWIRNPKRSIFIRILLFLLSIPITLVGLFALVKLSPILQSINIEPASLMWYILFTGTFYLLIIELLFLPSTKSRVLFLMLVLIPFLIAYPKSLKNNYCIRNAPLNQMTRVWNSQTGIWKGRPVRFEIASNTGYPSLYNIYSQQTNELLESDVEIKDLNGKNQCAGLEFPTYIDAVEIIGGGYGILPACLGVPIPKCELDKDHANKANGYYMRQ